MTAFAENPSFLRTSPESADGLIRRIVEQFDQYPDLATLIGETARDRWERLVSAVDDQVQVALVGPSGVGKSTLVQQILKALTGLELTIPILAINTTPFVFQYQVLNIPHPQICLSSSSNEEVQSLVGAFIHDFPLRTAEMRTGEENGNVRLPRELFRLISRTLGLDPQNLPETVAGMGGAFYQRLRGPQDTLRTEITYDGPIEETATWLNNALGWIALRAGPPVAQLGDFPFPSLVEVKIPASRITPRPWKIFDTRGLPKSEETSKKKSKKTSRAHHLGGLIDETVLRDPGIVFISCDRFRNLGEGGVPTVSDEIVKLLGYLRSSQNISLLQRSAFQMLSHHSEVFQPRLTPFGETIPVDIVKRTFELTYLRALRAIDGVVIPPDPPFSTTDARVEAEIAVTVQTYESWAFALRIHNLRELLTITQTITTDYVRWYREVFLPLVRATILPPTVVDEAIGQLCARLLTIAPQTLRASMNRDGGWSVDIPTMFASIAALILHQRVATALRGASNPVYHPVALDSLTASIDQTLFPSLRSVLEASRPSGPWTACRAEWGRTRSDGLSPYRVRISAHISPWLVAQRETFSGKIEAFLNHLGQQTPIRTLTPKR